MVQALPVKEQAKCGCHSAANLLKSSPQMFIFSEMGGTGTHYYGNSFDQRAGTIYKQQRDKVDWNHHRGSATWRHY